MAYYREGEIEYLSFSYFFVGEIAKSKSLLFYCPFGKEGFSMTKESVFQHQLIKQLKTEFPGCVVLKNDANYIQGFPDLTVLFSDGRWATLECKRFDQASKRPNQQYYVNKLNQMSFSRFISPDNEKDVIYELHQTFGTRRPACVSGSE